MRSSTAWLLPALLVGWLTSAGPALAQPERGADPAPRVQDSAGLFSEAGVQKANAGIADIKRRLKKDLLIETFAAAPAVVSDVNLDDKKAKRQFFQQWAIREAQSHRVNGIYLLICKNPHYVQVVVGEETRKRGLFTDANEQELADEVIAGLKSKDKDEALRKAVAFVSRTLERNEAAAAPVANSAHPPSSRGQPPAAEPEVPSWTGYICLAVVAILVIWVIFGVIRAVTRSGGGYGGGGYGGGGYGYGGGGYGGGGGGGFFSSLVGGMFGAAAGMWMYNNFFGGGSHGYQGSSGLGAGGSGGVADPGSTSPPSDVGGEYHAGGGGDWDAGAGGGGEDAGGGGGDWGGGGDAGGGDAGGGGGDWGGGGDAGGGGGGDWGGGGGGDAGGGGGGDW